MDEVANSRDAAAMALMESITTDGLVAYRALVDAAVQRRYERFIANFIVERRA